MNFRFSDQSRRAKQCGVELLSLTRGYEDLRVPAGLGVTPLAVLGIVARARQLLKAVHREADAGDALGAAIATRAINESLLTLAWLDRDPELGEIVWILDEIRTRLSHHKEVADEERRQRRQAKRRGEVVEPVAPGRSLGLLDRRTVRHLKDVEKETRARAGKLKRKKQRQKRMRVGQIGRMPSFADRAKVAGMPWVYSLAYRSDSNSAAHPSPLAIERFLEARSDGIHIRATPKGPVPDPYYVAAQLFSVLVEVAGHHVNQTALEPRLKEIRATLDELANEVRRASDS